MTPEEDQFFQAFKAGAEVGHGLAVAGREPFDELLWNSYEEWLNADGEVDDV